MTSQGGFVEVPIDPEFPQGWKKKVYELNGRLVPRWTIWIDNEGKKFVNEDKVRAKLAEIKEREMKEETAIGTNHIAARITASDKVIETNSDDIKIVHNARKSTEPTKNYTCHICSLDFTKEDEFKSHERLHRNMPCPSIKAGKRVDETCLNNPSIFNCLHCGKKFTRKADHEKHQLVHQSLQPYACDQCHQRFSEYGNFVKHKERSHRSVNINYDKNEVVREATNGYNSLKEPNIENFHPMNHPFQAKVTEEFQFSCDTCDKAYSTKKSLIRHKKDRHPSTAIYDEKVNKYESPSLKSHVNSHELGISTYRAPITQESLQIESLERREAMKEQFRRQLGNKSIDTPEQQYAKCVEAADKVKSKNLSFRNVEASFGTKVFEDTKQSDVGGIKSDLIAGRDSIPESWQQNAGLFTSMVNSGIGVKVKADKLPPLTNMSSDLEYKRQPSSTINQHYNCDLCDKVFPVKQSLTKHRKNVHPDAPSLKDDPAYCDICGNEYRSRSHMTDHRRKVHRKILAQIANPVGTNHQISLADNVNTKLKESNRSDNNSRGMEQDVDLDNACEAVTETLINKRLSEHMDVESGNGCNEEESKSERTDPEDLTDLKDSQSIGENERTGSCDQLVENEETDKFDANSEIVKYMTQVSMQDEVLKRSNDDKPEIGEVQSKRDQSDKPIEELVINKEEEEELDENVPIEDSDISLDKVCDEEQANDIETIHDERDDNMNTSLDIVTDFYNNIIIENSKNLGNLSTISCNEPDDLIIEQYEADDNEQRTSSEDDEYISSVSENLDTSLDRATDFYNKIVFGNSGNRDDPATKVDCVGTKFTNDLENGGPVEVSNIEDEIMLFPVEREELTIEPVQTMEHLKDGGGKFLEDQNTSADFGSERKEMLDQSSLLDCSGAGTEMNDNYSVKGQIIDQATEGHEKQIQRKIVECRVEERQDQSPILNCSGPEGWGENDEFHNIKPIVAGDEAFEERVENSTELKNDTSRVEANLPAHKVLKCKLCPASFSKRKQLKKHLIQHKSKLLDATTEKECLRNEASAELNSVAHEGLKAEITGEDSDLVTERQNPLENANGYNFNSIVDKNNMHPTSSELSEDKSNNCYICHKSFSSKGNMKHHVRKVHKIDIDGKRTDKLQLQLDHNNRIDSSKKRGIELDEESSDEMANKRPKLLRELQCNQCPKLYKGKQALISHKESVHEGIKHPCNSCDYKSNSKPQLIVHNQAEHEGITHPCKSCNYVTKFRSSLISHIKRNHQDLG